MNPDISIHRSVVARKDKRIAVEVVVARNARLDPRPHPVACGPLTRAFLASVPPCPPSPPICWDRATREWHHALGRCLALDTVTRRLEAALARRAAPRATRVVQERPDPAAPRPRVPLAGPAPAPPAPLPRHPHLDLPPAEREPKVTPRTDLACLTPEARKWLAWCWPTLYPRTPLPRATEAYGGGGAPRPAPLAAPFRVRTGADHPYDPAAYTQMHLTPRLGPGEPPAPRRPEIFPRRRGVAFEPEAAALSDVATGALVVQHLAADLVPEKPILGTLRDLEVAVGAAHNGEGYRATQYLKQSGDLRGVAEVAERQHLLDQAFDPLVAERAAAAEKGYLGSTAQDDADHLERRVEDYGDRLLLAMAALRAARDRQHAALRRLVKARRAVRLHPCEGCAEELTKARKTYERAAGRVQGRRVAIRQLREEFADFIDAQRPPEYWRRRHAGKAATAPVPADPVADALRRLYRRPREEWGIRERLEARLAALAGEARDETVAIRAAMAGEALLRRHLADLDARDALAQLRRAAAALAARIADARAAREAPAPADLRAYKALLRALEAA